MKDKLHRVLKTGYGLGLLSAAKARAIAEQLRDDLHLDKKESLQLAKQLVASSEKVTLDVIKMVDKHLSEALVKSKLVKKNELSCMKEKMRRHLWPKKSSKTKKSKKK